MRETDLCVQGLRIFLVASVLAGARAKNKHNRVLAQATVFMHASGPQKRPITKVLEVKLKST